MEKKTTKNTFDGIVYESHRKLDTLSFFKIMNLDAIPFFAIIRQIVSK